MTVGKTFSSHGQAVTLDVFPVPSAGKHPAVLVLHGSFGLMPQTRPTSSRSQTHSLSKAFLRPCPTTCNRRTPSRDLRC
jgi:hypothetical protein